MRWPEFLSHYLAGVSMEYVEFYHAVGTCWSEQIYSHFIVLVILISC